MTRDLFQEKEMRNTSKTSDQIALIKALGPLGVKIIGMFLDFFSKKRREAKKEAKKAAAYAAPKDMDNLDAG